MNLIANIADPGLRLRAAWAEAVALALKEAHPHDACAICFAFLQSVETGGPMLGDPFGMVAADARLWAAAAPPHELVAFTLAGLGRLPKTHLAVASRKRVFARLWETFDPKDRQAFLTRVDAKGQFLGRGTA